jgi:excisionase family DNA binding protein
MTALLSVAEVAERFQVSEETVRRWARTGRIPTAGTPGREIRFDPDIIAAIIATRPDPEDPT